MKYEEYFPSERNDVHYQRYIRFIEERKQLGRPTGVLRCKGYEVHHIVPRVYIPKECERDRENLIALTPREHYIAHLILWKSFGREMTSAFNLISSSKGIDLTSRQYESLKEELSDYYSEIFSGEGNPSYGRHCSEETKRKISQAEKGKKMSDESRKKMSESHKGSKNYNFGKPMSEEQRKKLSKVRKGKYTGVNHPMYGRTHSEEARKKMSENNKRWYASVGKTVKIMKDNRLKVVPEKELDTYIQNGWKRESYKGLLTGRIRINNGTQVKTVTVEDYENIYAPNGWVKGFIIDEKFKEDRRKGRLKMIGSIRMYKNGEHRVVKKEDIKEYYINGWEPSPRSVADGRFKYEDYEGLERNI